MPEYDSQNWNLFRYPLIWFLIAAAFAQMTIAIYSPESHAAPSAAVEAALPPYKAPQYPHDQRPVIAPVKEVKKALPPELTFVASNSINTVIQFALAQRGKPYRWGAAGPSSYDCSGLVVAAFSKIGMRLPHYTGALIRLGKALSRSALQPGDLVFPSSHHVGIYLGNNQYVNAPQPGEVVKVSSVYAFYAARRLA